MNESTISLYTPVTNLPIEKRAAGLLSRAGILITYDLLHLSDDQIRNIKYMKPNHAQSIIDLINNALLGRIHPTVEWPHTLVYHKWIQSHEPSVERIQNCRSNILFVLSIRNALQKARECGIQFNDTEIADKIDSCVRFAVSLYETLYEHAVIQFVDDNAIAARAAASFLNAFDFAAKLQQHLEVIDDEEE